LFWLFFHYWGCCGKVGLRNFIYQRRSSNTCLLFLIKVGLRNLIYQRRSRDRFRGRPLIRWRQQSW
jgi:hypothetical protein